MCVGGTTRRQVTSSCLVTVFNLLHADSSIEDSMPPVQRAALDRYDDPLSPASWQAPSERRQSLAR